MQRLLYLITFLLAVTASYGQPAGKKAGHTNPPPVKVVVHVPLIIKNDTAAINVRLLDSNAIKTYSKQPEFNYGEDITTSPSLWTRFWKWFWNLILDLFKSIDFGKHDYSPFMIVLMYVIKYVLIIAGLGALIFFILKLAGIDMMNIFRRRALASNLEYSESLENIHEINFDDEIEKAITQHNYRLAVRLLYLRSLKHLSDAGLIKWQLDKTNSAYINELTNNDQRTSFKSLTLQFEYIWYGEFAINTQVFNSINTSFTNFKKSIL